MADSAMQQRGRVAPAGHPLFLDDAESDGGIEAPREPHRFHPPGKTGDGGVVKPGDMKEGARHEGRGGMDARRLRRAGPRSVEEPEADEGDDVAMRMDGSFGATGGAARVKKDGRIVLGNGNIWQLHFGVRFGGGLEIVFHDQEGNAGISVQSREALAIDDEQLRLGVFDARANLGTGPPRVEPHRDGAETDGRPERSPRAMP
jgi:hypothetical protein